MKPTAFPDPVALFRAQLFVGLMAMEASAVIWMRVLGMGGLWAVPKSENSRMVAEKQLAFTLAGQKALTAMAHGKPADAVLMAAARPLRRKTRANRKRLTGLGPRRIG
ncbi:antifreeze protein [Lutimaribacter marinistellae]|uniref:Antifreeze protein n=1 Tax=Lutimaribacter marinistellae TaxID=1820329 RepID=A0ABV7TPN0_9RHOB